MIQLELFPEVEKDTFQLTAEVAELRQLCNDTKTSSDKVRRGIFARHNELACLYLEIHQRLEVIERNICNERR